jgi:type I restriction enzyme R subunit
LIVKSMLLTGFDAANAQVLYLDRLIQQAELLQAIAGVNRTAAKKSYGLIVDYYGVSDHLAEALTAYTGACGCG